MYTHSQTNSTRTHLYKYNSLLYMRYTDGHACIIAHVHVEVVSLPSRVVLYRREEFCVGACVLG